MAGARVKQWEQFSRFWWLFDAKWQHPKAIAEKVKIYLMGKHKPIYHPFSDCGDQVVIVNTRHVAMKGDEWFRKKFYHHTGYPGGFSEWPAWVVQDQNPTKVVWKYIYHSIPASHQRRTLIQRLHLFPDEDVPEEVMRNVSAQIRQMRAVPRTLDEHTQEEIDSFPKLYEWPDDYVIHPDNEQISKPS